jgi:hypothetical protein
MIDLVETLGLDTAAERAVDRAIVIGTIAEKRNRAGTAMDP